MQVNVDAALTRVTNDDTAPRRFAFFFMQRWWRPFFSFWTGLHRGAAAAPSDKYVVTLLRLPEFSFICNRRLASQRQSNFLGDNWRWCPTPHHLFLKVSATNSLFFLCSLTLFTWKAYAHFVSGKKNRMNRLVTNSRPKNNSPLERRGFIEKKFVPRVWCNFSKLKKKGKNNQSPLCSEIKRKRAALSAGSARRRWQWSF